MTRKHYVKMAEALKSARNGATSQDERIGIFKVEQALIEIFRQDNRRFDANRFRVAASED